MNDHSWYCLLIFVIFLYCYLADASCFTVALSSKGLTSNVRVASVRFVAFVAFAIFKRVGESVSVGNP